MQMEVIQAQCDSSLKAKFIEVDVPEFYEYLPATFENTRELACEIISMFGAKSSAVSAWLNNIEFEAILNGWLSVSSFIFLR
ncbi:UNVERIFIED_CONTAM: General transcription factor II-I repeat domain-containing protein 2B [Trichonephila clavipes]